MITNFEIIEFLIADGGMYTREEHIAIIRKRWPDADISPYSVSALRQSMLRSTFVTAEYEPCKGGYRIRVTAVDKKYTEYARVRTGIEPSTNTYLRGEPPEVIACITLRKMFDGLLARHRAKAQGV